MHADVRVTIHPNAFAPVGSVSALPELLAALEAGRGLLRWQRFDDRRHLEVGGEGVLTRTTWSGETNLELPGLPTGTRLRANVASLVSFDGDRILAQENFDCYYPAEPPTA